MWKERTETLWCYERVEPVIIEAFVREEGRLRCTISIYSAPLYIVYLWTDYQHTCTPILNSIQRCMMANLIMMQRYSPQPFGIPEAISFGRHSSIAEDKRVRPKATLFFLGIAQVVIGGSAAGTFKMQLGGSFLQCICRWKVSLINEDIIMSLKCSKMHWMPGTCKFG